MPSNSDNLLENHLRLYGSHTIAYSSVFDKQMISYYLPDKGIVRYGVYNNIRFMLGDPLCSVEDRGEVVKGFIDDTNANSNILIGLQCSFETASAFCKYGYNANHMGVETILHLDKFDTKGKEMTKVRRWINSATNAGVEVREESISESEIIEKIKRISDKWLETKKNTCELNLLTRPLTFEKEPGVRYFCGYLKDKIVGINTFEPIYENNKAIGYYANICRIDDEAPNGTLDLIMQKARESFKSEGCTCFSLGLSPLADIKDEHNFHNPILSAMLESNYRYGNELYSFQGLDFHKKAYYDGINSERRPTFLIMKGVLPINQIINTLKYIGILPNKGFVSCLSYIAEHMVKGFYEQQYGVQQNVMPALSNMLQGMNNEDISAKYNLSSAMVESLANVFTAIGRQKLPEFQEKLYIQRNFIGTSRDIFAKVEDIVDREEEVLLVYNMGVHPAEDGYYVSMAIEVDGKTTVSKANFILARIKSRIIHCIPDVLGVLIETAPAGQYAYKLGLSDIESKIHYF